jgi:hypothetical protein
MKRTKIFFIAFALLTICGIGVVFYIGKGRLNRLSRTTDSSTHTLNYLSDEKSGDLSSVEKKMAMMQRKMDQMSFTQVAMKQQQSTNDEKDDNDDSTVDDEDDYPIDDSIDPMESSYIEAENQGLLIDSQMAREGRDPEWSSESEEGISKKVLNLSLPELASEEVTCSSNICKVSLDFGKKQNLDLAMNDSLELFTSLATWNSGSFFRSDKQGSLHLYFPREGTELPRL